MIPNDGALAIRNEGAALNQTRRFRAASATDRQSATESSAADEHFVKRERDFENDQDHDVTLHP
jgi:hypothetical protein